MRLKMRFILVGILAVGVVALTGCMGGWFTQNQQAYLVIGAPVVTGGHGEVIISVVNMPQEGMASMAVKVDGMTYNNAKIANIAVAGLNGFTVLASSFDDATGKGVFVIANANAGSVDGTVAKLTFDATGNVTAADVAFGKDHIELGSHLNTLITGWQLSTGKAYYANDAAQAGDAK